MVYPRPMRFPLLLILGLPLLPLAACATAGPKLPPTLVGYVLDAHRIPVPNARVQVLLASASTGGNRPEAIQISNLGGVFQVKELLGSGTVIPLVPETTYKVLVEQPDYRIWEGEVAFRGGIEEVEIELQPVEEDIEDSRPIDPDAVDPVMEGQIREGT